MPSQKAPDVQAICLRTHKTRAQPARSPSWFGGDRQQDLGLTYASTPGSFHFSTQGPGGIRLLHQPAGPAVWFAGEAA